MNLNQNDTLLFQGDSITDCGRNRGGQNQAPPPNNPQCLGAGYAGSIASKLLARFPERGLSIHNRGVSGNRVTDMAARWEPDIASVCPDVVSFLIGVNDTWHGAAKGTPENGTDLQTFEQTYRDLTARLKKEFPGVRLVICEPFTLECGAVTELAFHPDIDDRRAIVKQIADEVADVWVPFQECFDELSQAYPPEIWAGDGVHPTPAGHEKMSEFWLERVLG